MVMLWMGSAQRLAAFHLTQEQGRDKRRIGDVRLMWIVRNWGLWRAPPCIAMRWRGSCYRSDRVVSQGRSDWRVSEGRTSLERPPYVVNSGNGAIAGTSTTSVKGLNFRSQHSSSCFSYVFCTAMENTDAPALLLLPGFGVGSFHYDLQLGREYRVWAIDFLGQGKSWPSHDPAPAEEVMEEVLEGQANASTRDWGFGETPEPWAQELVYSVDIERDQVHAFMEKVIGEPVYIVGNSLGGYVGTYFAATNPELLKGMALLNATSFWAFTPNARRYPLLSKLVPWGGLLPVPAVARVVIRVCLKEKRTPMCMIYGKEDPWVVPFWGQRAKQRNLDAVSYELSPAGHCPHHEVPEVVNTLVRKWVESVQSQGALSPAQLDAGVNHKQLHWFVVENEGKRVAVLVKGTQGFWSNLMDSFREVFSKHLLQSRVVEAVEETY